MPPLVGTLGQLPCFSPESLNSIACQLAVATAHAVSQQDYNVNVKLKLYDRLHLFVYTCTRIYEISYVNTCFVVVSYMYDRYKHVPLRDCFVCVCARARVYMCVRSHVPVRLLVVLCVCASSCCGSLHMACGRTCSRQCRFRRPRPVTDATTPEL